MVVGLRGHELDRDKHVVYEAINVGFGYLADSLDLLDLSPYLIRLDIEKIHDT